MEGVIQDTPVHAEWKPILLKAVAAASEELQKIDFANSYPARDDIFHAFCFFPPSEMRVVILGMDPYINPGEAHGLAFSVANVATVGREMSRTNVATAGTGASRKMPPSLRNIFREIARTQRAKDGGVLRKNTDLTDWASQGVLLLNVALTTHKGISGAHLRHWMRFTTAILEYIRDNCKNIVFMLWGKNAQAYRDVICDKNNFVLEHSHPSPLSRKPFACPENGHFEKCNAFLKTNGFREIVWSE